MSDGFPLGNDTAERLYHSYADLAEIWLGERNPDSSVADVLYNYKWSIMRFFDIPKEVVINATDSKERITTLA